MVYADQGCFPFINHASKPNLVAFHLIWADEPGTEYCTGSVRSGAICRAKIKTVRVGRAGKRVMSDKIQTSSILDRIRGALGNEAARGIMATMMMKVLSAVIAFTLFSFASNAAGAEEFGRFSIFFSIASLLSVVAAGGQGVLIVRSWNEYRAKGKPGLARGALHYGGLVSLAGIFLTSLVFVALMMTDASWNALYVDGNLWLLAAAIAFLCANCLSLYSSHAARAIVGIKLGDANYELTWRFLGILFLGLCLVFGYGARTEEILAVFCVGLLLVIITQLVYVRRRVRAELGTEPPRYDNRSWAPRSIRLWLAAVMEAANQHMEVILIGMLVDPVAAGAYFVASRLANAFALAASGLHTFGSRRVPGLYFEGKTKELKHVLHLMALMALVIFVGGMGAVLLFGDYMLLIFGAFYLDYYPVFLILCIGTALTAANGPAPSFLMLTGHEDLYMKIVTASVMYRIIGFSLIVPFFGILGAAIVTASVMVITALLLNIICRRNTGMDPSILRLVLESRDRPPHGAKANRIQPEGAS